jgi:hypothetical protein
MASLNSPSKKKDFIAENSAPSHPLPLNRPSFQTETKMKDATKKNCIRIHSQIGNPDAKSSLKPTANTSWQLLQSPLASYFSSIKPSQNRSSHHDIQNISSISDHKLMIIPTGENSDQSVESSLLPHNSLFFNDNCQTECSSPTSIQSLPAKKKKKRIVSEKIAKKDGNPETNKNERTIEPEDGSFPTIISVGAHNHLLSSGNKSSQKMAKSRSSKLMSPDSAKNFLSNSQRSTRQLMMVPSREISEQSNLPGTYTLENRLESHATPDSEQFDKFSPTKPVLLLSTDTHPHHGTISSTKVLKTDFPRTNLNASSSTARRLMMVPTSHGVTRRASMPTATTAENRLQPYAIPNTLEDDKRQFNFSSLSGFQSLPAQNFEDDNSEKLNARFKSPSAHLKTSLSTSNLTSATRSESKTASNTKFKASSKSSRQLMMVPTGENSVRLSTARTNTSEVISHTTSKSLKIENNNTKGGSCTPLQPSNFVQSPPYQLPDTSREDARQKLIRIHNQLPNFESKSSLIPASRDSLQSLQSIPKSNFSSGTVSSESYASTSTTRGGNLDFNPQLMMIPSWKNSGGLSIPGSSNNTAESNLLSQGTSLSDTRDNRDSCSDPLQRVESSPGQKEKYKNTFGESMTKTPKSLSAHLKANAAKAAAKSSHSHLKGSRLNPMYPVRHGAKLPGEYFRSYGFDEDPDAVKPKIKRRDLDDRSFGESRTSITSRTTIASVSIAEPSVFSVASGNSSHTSVVTRSSQASIQSAPAALNRWEVDRQVEKSSVQQSIDPGTSLFKLISPSPNIGSNTLLSSSDDVNISRKVDPNEEAWMNDAKGVPHKVCISFRRLTLRSNMRELRDNLTYEAATDPSPNRRRNFSAPPRPPLTISPPDKDIKGISTQLQATKLSPDLPGNDKNNNNNVDIEHVSVEKSDKEKKKKSKKEKKKSKKKSKSA